MKAIGRPPMRIGSLEAPIIAIERGASNGVRLAKRVAARGATPAGADGMGLGYPSVMDRPHFSGGVARTCGRSVTRRPAPRKAGHDLIKQVCVRGGPYRSSRRPA